MSYDHEYEAGEEDEAAAKLEEAMEDGLDQELAAGKAAAPGAAPGAGLEVAVPAEEVEGELVAPAELVNPSTGETVALREAPTADLGLRLSEVRELEGLLREYKGALSRELLRRMDEQASWTLREPGVKLTGDAPPKPDYDGAKLAEALDPLVAAGTITAQAMEEAVELEENWKPKKKGINALVKLGGDVAAAVKLAEVPPSKSRSVSVSRTRDAE